MKVLILFLSFVGITVGSYCGQSGVPFSLEVAPDGQPILGCARPSCFGWDAEGKRAADSAQFYRINRKPDGFLRATDTQGPVISNATGFKPQYAFCERTYYWNQCFGANQWIGGIAPLSKISSDVPFQVLCCTYDRLSQATDQGTAQIRPGQTVVGGEIKGDDGRQHSFEYISNIQRNFDERGQAIYHVTMKRFPCLPEPIYQEVGVEDGTSDFLVENIKKELKPENVQYAAKTAEAQTPISFDETKFDIPKDLPNEDSNPEEEPKLLEQPPAPTTAPQGFKTLPDGRVVPCAKTFADIEAQEPQPVAISQNNSSSAQNYSSQGYYNYYNYYQPNLLDPLGLFQQAVFPASQASVPSVPSTPTQNAAPTFVQNPVPQPSVPETLSAATVAPTTYSQNYYQSNPQTYSYNPFWPFYSYNQYPYGSYGTQNQAASAQPQSQPQPAPVAPALPSYGSNSVAPAPHPKPIPLRIPSVEEVEQSIPESGRRMIVRVARTLLGL